MSTPTTESFDVIICGSGHIGSCLALALVKDGYCVALVDSLSPEQRQQRRDNRVFALSNKTRTILENLNSWPLLQKHVTPIKHLHISNKGSFGAARLHAEDMQEEALGYMLESRVLQQTLDHATAEQSITLFSPATIENVQQHPEHITVTLKDKILSANCLIGTDGTDSFVRQQARIGVTRKDYQQKALVATIDLHHSHSFTAYERWVDDTAIALLPHSPWRSVLIWSGDNEYIDQLMGYEDGMFLRHLQHAVGYRLGKLSSISERYAYPLFQVQADKVVEKRLLLMGNAAQTLHPMGAQGFNLALKHVALFSHLLRERRRNGENDFSQELLNDYAEQQEKETARTLTFTDRAVELSSHIGPLNTTARTLLINALGSSRIAQRALLYTR